jgi:glutathione synthase
MNISFLLYPTRSVKVDEDSSFWIIHELRSRGHHVRYFESKDMTGGPGGLGAYLTPARTDARRGFLPSVRSKKAAPLEDQDVIFIRKEPPFDQEYLYALQLLSRLKRPFVLNDPAGIALCNEKLSILDFPQYAPNSFVTSDPEKAARFARHLGAPVVVKPLDNKAGQGVFRTRHGDKDFKGLLEQATRLGSRSVMLQRYLPHQKSGDKRILVLDGRFLGCFTRVPSRGEFRANLSLGGSMRRAALSRREERMLEAMAPYLRKHGLYFVGLDVINGCLSEINVTSPSGIPEIRALGGKRLEKTIVDFMERRSARL